MNHHKKKKLPSIVGHRGSRGTHIENTFPSFQEAVDSGADYLETDIQLSADGVPIIFHDSHISGRLCRNLDGSIVAKPLCVRELTAAELKQFFCGTYIDYFFPEQRLNLDEKIPSLQDLFEWREKHHYQIGLILELKMHSELTHQLPQPVKFVKIVIELLRQFNLMDQVILQSFDANIVAEAIKQDSSLKVTRLFREEPSYAAESVSTGLKRICVYDKDLSGEAIKSCKSKGINVSTFTVNEEKQWKKFLDAGVDAIITDYPRKLKEYLNS